ncbi:P2R1A-PPP2R2A-interacting phosphatase regulator 1 [Octopus bimaculoides]|uniref:P2R1A-PPP2R2A-interacting phosphatase regulator 1 n=1 Tax=Octopus bimaculoides TaxID=37653 RepID=UPI00071DB8E0|nr:P2R1A-PPP2R2A-interacting phosphatase regulator 1 [Octopus bimaculoides]|eukprot:XP_014781799.1 PREDICTED: protein FAM122A-like [Octopus bimaculoides]
MEVDPPSVSSCPSTVGTSSCGTGGLKRSNSAPMINVLTVSAVDYSPSLIKQESKIRRFSSSNMSLNNLNSNLKIPDRINQIKREESHITDRETEHERQIQNAITMSNSWEDFSLEEAMLPERRSRSCSESLSIITLPAMACGSPSPPPPQQRLGKQCFSPSMQVPVKNVAFLSSPTHSPNTKTLMSGDGEKFDCYLTPPKRLNTGTSPVRNITATHPKFLTMSSNSSMDECCSPEPCIQPPRSLSISSLSPLSPLQSGKPAPMYSFTPVRDTRDMGATDSENSDMSESTDHILGPMDSPSFPGMKQAPPV